MRFFLSILLTLLFLPCSFSQSTPADGFKLLDQGQYESAFQLFSNLYALSPDNISVQIGYGRAMGLNGQSKDANDFFQSTLEQHPNELELQLNYAESLLWIKEAKVAKAYYDTLLVSHPDNYICYIGKGNAYSILKDFDNAIVNYNKAKELNPDLAYIDTQINYANIGKAYLFLEKGRFNAADEVFNQMLEKDSTNFDANYGKANISYTLYNYNTSNRYLDSLKQDSNQLKVIAPLLGRLGRENAIQIGGGLRWLRDNNDNKQLTYNVNARIPATRSLSFLLNYDSYRAENLFLDNQAKNRYASLGFNFKKSRWDTKLLVGTAMINSTEDEKSNSLLFDGYVSYKAEGNHIIKAFANKRVYDYTTSLVDSGITFTDIGLEYNGKLFNTIGVFGQYIHTTFSDQNTRDLGLLSLYYNIKEQPILKTGINLHYITFQENVPLDYYSPGSLFISEAFVEWNSMVLENRKVGTRLEFVPGMLIENGTQARFAYRATAEVIVRPTSNLHFNAKLMTGSYAAIESKGYRFWSAELGFKWYITKK